LSNDAAFARAPRFSSLASQVFRCDGR